ncbi:MAG: hypothetical protein AAF543_12960 [Pseudomonadota bacterium]
MPLPVQFWEQGAGQPFDEIVMPAMPRVGEKIFAQQPGRVVEMVVTEAGYDVAPGASIAWIVVHTLEG